VARGDKRKKEKASGDKTPSMGEEKGPYRTEVKRVRG